MTFELHPRLAADSLHLGDLPLCQLRLMNDQRFYWLLLIPRLADAIEVTDLNEQQYVEMWQEVRQLAEVIKPITGADKLNVATLGNMVPQLHLHLIARFKTDPAWPGPIWGVGSAEHYTDADISRLKSALQQACSHLPIHWV